ncbi:HNH endonuclease [Anaeromyxobacter paludicola]|uniref:HNH nuclease domain-containing protein n=1 Tax=Anaeromyxobacter paludicola TaxID=2918171 RepID=A0ABN6NEM0_9BACT|nr:HNH endonuclease signature motif containing protein [Anaeromyxobacter paludicola]BDG10507.1 hypothetical protein AMPC_36200 [Anaeromyxobacter paludicola]
MNSALSETARLAQLLRKEQGALAEFLLALADFDRQRRWLELGHSSLFYYLHRELGLSKGAAHYRKVADELVRRFPEVVEPLREGKLCITSVVALAKVMTPENRHEVLPRFFHCSKREAMAEAAAISPAEATPRREVVTAVPVGSGTRTIAASAGSGMGENTQLLVQPVELDRTIAPVPTSTAPLTSTATATPTPPAPPHPPRAAADPLTADLRRLHITVSRRFLEKLEAARDALSHACPGGFAEEILEAGLDLLLDRSARRKGLVAKPRAATGRTEVPDEPEAEAAARDRYVPAHVRREVWKRDEGRCQWPLASGGVCGSTRRLELDHVIPRALGGRTTAVNLRVLCRAHNDLAARGAYGDEWMDRFTRRTAGSASPAATEDER